MKLDSYKTLVMEHCSWPGNIGDSCAESSRYKHLADLMGESDLGIDLFQFVTDKGFVRHSTAPEKDDKGNSWRESDFSSDQATPLFLGANSYLNNIKETLRHTISKNGWKTGNGDFVTPTLFSFLKNSNIGINLTTAIQALLFRFKYRWSDENNKFEENEESSAEYLNWIQEAIYCNKFVRKLVPKEILKKKIRSYYAIEPNVQFLIDLYDKAIDKYFY